MKLAAQLYTIHDYTKNESDIERSLYKIKEIGYNAIQISAFGEYRTPWLADLLQKLQLEVCVTHMPYARIVGDVDRLIEEHRMLGCSTIGLGSLPKYDRASVTATFEELAPSIDKIHEAGMKFVFHNHWKEFIPDESDGKNTFDLYCERFPADRAGILMDFYWLVYACQKPMAKFLQCGFEVFIKSVGFFRVSRAGKRGAASGRNIGTQSELGNDQSCSADIQKRTVHFPLFI